MPLHHSSYSHLPDLNDWLVPLPVDTLDLLHEDLPRPETADVRTLLAEALGPVLEVAHPDNVPRKLHRREEGVAQKGRTREVRRGGEMSDRGGIPLDPRVYESRRTEGGDGRGEEVLGEEGYEGGVTHAHELSGVVKVTGNHAALGLWMRRAGLGRGGEGWWGGKGFR